MRRGREFRHLQGQYPCLDFFLVFQTQKNLKQASNLSRKCYPALTPLREQKRRPMALFFVLAERERFELSIPFRIFQFSRLVHSTTLPPLQYILLSRRETTNLQVVHSVTSIFLLENLATPARHRRAFAFGLLHVFANQHSATSPNWMRELYYRKINFLQCV